MKTEERLLDYDPTPPRRPQLATDCLALYEDGEHGKLVLIDRGHPPAGLALPGGHWDYGLTFEENAVKEFKEETGLDLHISRLWGTRSQPDRDPRGHYGTLIFAGSATGTLSSSGGDDAKAAALYAIDDVEALFGQDRFAFDHEAILQEFVEEWRRQIAYDLGSYL